MLWKTKSYIIGTERNLFQSDGEKGSKQITHDAQHVENTDSTEQLEPVGRVKSAQAKFTKHWRRFWCCYLLGAIIFLAIFLPVFFLVIIPAIAQRIVDDTDLPIYSAEILNPRPDQIDFVLHTSLSIPAGVSVRTDPLSLDLFDRDVKPMQTYLRVDLPEYNIKGKTKLDVTRHNTKILDMEQFIKTLTDAVYHKRFTMSAKGSTIGHLGALKTPLTLDKDIDLDGLDKLRGFAIDSARLLIPKEEDGTNLRGKAILPNHSVFTFALGNVTLNMKSADILLGKASIDNVVLKPGNNSVDLRGHLDLDVVLANIGTILAAQKSALGDGELELTASGNTTIYNGEHIKYFEDILNGLSLTTRVPIVMVLMETLKGLVNKADGGGLDIAGILGDLTNNTDTALKVRSLRDFMDG